MKDPRIERLAQVLLHHSCRIQAGQKLLIEAIDLPDPAARCVGWSKLPARLVQRRW